MLIETGFPGLAAIFILSPTSQSHECRFSARRSRSNPTTGFESVELRQSQIQEYDVRVKCFRGSDGLESIKRARGFMPIQHQQLCK